MNDPARPVVAGSPVSLVRPDLRRFAAYEAASRAADAVRLHANESAWRHDWDTSASGLNRYPDPRPDAVVDRIAELYGVPENEVLLTRGSDDGIDVLLRTMCAAGKDRIVICPPTFGMYAVAARLQGAIVDSVPLIADQDFALDSAAVIAAGRRAKLVFLCSPNNPTGNTIPAAQVIEICRAMAGQGLVVVDEAYAEFAPEQSLIRLRRECGNLVLLRTLSKAYALAGARLGALIADADLVRLLRSVLPPYPVPSLCIEAAERLLQPAPLARAQAEAQATAARREVLRRALADLPAVARVWPSAGNFLLVRCRDAAAVLLACADAQLLIRDFSRVPGLENCVRVTVGDAPQNARLLEAFGRAAVEAAHG
ncbi:MAG: histidinol-phosphate transaminase [Gammaproteobacteria bacterium]